jgi:hypothetical protein
MLRFTDFQNYTFFSFFFHNQEISNPPLSFTLSLSGFASFCLTLSFILNLSHARDLIVALASCSPSHHCDAAHAHDQDRDHNSRLRSRSRSRLMLTIEIVPHACDLTAPHPFHAARNKLSPCEKEGREKRDEDKERGN